MYISEDDIKDFLFIKLLECGVMADDADLTLLSELFFEYLIELDLICLDDEEPLDEDIDLSNR